MHPTRQLGPDEYGGSNRDEPDTRPFQLRWRNTPTKMSGQIIAPSWLVPALLSFLILLAGAWFWASDGWPLGAALMFGGQIPLYAFTKRRLD